MRRFAPEVPTKSPQIATLERVEGLVGVPVELISVGPGRDETIARLDPFRPA